MERLIVYGVAGGKVETMVEHNELTGIGYTIYLWDNVMDNTVVNNASTSAACATASGAAALIFSYNPCLSNSEVRELLKNTAMEVSLQWNYYNYD